MDELFFKGARFISSKRASEITGYTKDYIGQLCRSEKIDSRLVGRNWYVNERAILAHRTKKVAGEEKSTRGNIALDPVRYVSGAALQEKESPYYTRDKRPLIPEPVRSVTTYEPKERYVAPVAKPKPIQTPQSQSLQQPRQRLQSKRDAQKIGKVGILGVLVPFGVVTLGTIVLFSFFAFESIRQYENIDNNATMTDSQIRFSVSGE